MTDLANTSQPLNPTQPSADDAQQARVDQLRRDRAARTSAPSRGHPAQGARVAAAGFGVTAMLGLVGVMGYAARSTAAVEPAVVSPPPPAQVTVVIHRNPVASTASEVAAGSGVPVDPAAVAAPTAPTVPAAPIALTAQPVVRQAPASQAPTSQAATAQAPAGQAPVAQAPVVKSNGSR